MNTISIIRKHSTRSIRSNLRSPLRLLNGAQDARHGPLTPALSHPMGKGLPAAFRLAQAGARRAGEGGGGAYPGDSSLAPARRKREIGFWLALLPLTLALAGCVSSHQNDRPPSLCPIGRDGPTPGAGSSPVAVLEPRWPELPDSSQVLDLRQAIALALRHSPTLASFSWEIRAAEARELQAGLWPNPEAAVDVENVGGSLQGFRESETTLSLAQAILFGGKRSRALRVAAAERQSASWAYESKRLDVLSEGVQAFVGVLGAQEKVRITRESLRIAQEVLTAAGKRVEAGDTPAVEKTRADVAHGQASAELLRATQALHTARLRLAASWGSPEPHFREVQGTLECELRLPPLEELKQRLTQNPEVRAAAVEVTKRQAALALERAKRAPDVSAMAGYRRIEGDDVNTVVFGFSAPLPLFDRNQGGIREAQANLSRTECQQQEVGLQAQVALAEAHAEMTTALEERRTFADRILPNATEAFEKTQEGYQQGSFDYLALLTAQETLAQTRASYLEVLVRLNTAAAKVERLIGVPITSPPLPTHDPKDPK